MSYINVDNNITEDIYNRKEFYVLKNKKTYVPEKNIIPLINIDDEIKNGNNLQYHSYQKFVQNYINTNTPYKSILMKHSTGSGKTIGSLGVAMDFIRKYKLESHNNIIDIGSVIIIGFDGSKNAFKKDLLKYSEFGIASKKEIKYLNKLTSTKSENAREYAIMLNKRLSNRKGNGFFRFYGYDELINRLIPNISDINKSLDDNNIYELIESGDIIINKDFLNIFKNSLLICDEIHNVYNTIEKNNRGIIIQYIIDTIPSLRTLFLSATPINNNPSELVDLLNLLLPKDLRMKRSDLFNSNNRLIKGAEIKIAELSRGRVSYLVNTNVLLYPRRIMEGESIPGIKYLKFIRCKVSAAYEKLYKKEFNTNETLSQESRYITDMIFPSPNGYIYTKSDYLKLLKADSKWLSDNKITIEDSKIGGDFLNIKNIKNISSKYHKMLLDIFDNIKHKRGKILIYHNFIILTGIHILEKILIANGILDYYSDPVDNTICVKCGKLYKDHTDIVEFMPCRFLSSDVDKLLLDKHISMFNSATNTNGHEYLILLGSKKIRESYNFKAIRNIYIMNRPDNIPSLIQIFGRAVRENSHYLLPEEKRNVYIRIYTSSLSSELSYEELKYKEKINDYITIQQIEKILHENAIDSSINDLIIKESSSNDNRLKDLNFTPILEQKNKIKLNTLKSLNKSTFDIYHRFDEISIITYIIKRLFLEHSPVFEYDNLFLMVKNPKFNIEYDTKLIDEDNFIVALSNLLYTKNYINVNSNELSISDMLFDSIDKRILYPDNTYRVIVHISNYYMLIPLIDNKLYICSDILYRNLHINKNRSINIYKYLVDIESGKKYKQNKEKFYNRYKDTNIENLIQAVCDFGVDFHIRFIEEVIVYIFNIWTDNRTTKSNMHEFYFKILYYYDLIDNVIFASTVTGGEIYNIYEEYLLPSDIDKENPNLESKDLHVQRNKRNMMNLIANNISKSSCMWCPNITKTLFEKNLSKSLFRFSSVKKVKKTKNIIIKADGNLLPVGHYIGKYPRFYIPGVGWKSYPSYISHRKDWKENPIIIGYYEKSKTGIHVRFKLRNPVQNIELHADTRLIERGSSCKHKSKKELLELCKKLKIDIDNNTSIDEICNEIKSKLLYLELIERSNNTNIKYFYTHFEQN